MLFCYILHFDKYLSYLFEQVIQKTDFHPASFRHDIMHQERMMDLILFNDSDAFQKK